MRKFNTILRPLSAFIGMSIGLNAVAQQETNSSEVTIEEIVVTALKREGQNIVDAPASIAVIDGDSIESLGVDQLEDFLQFSPGLSIDEAQGVAGAGVAAIQIRGVSATFGAASVGFYLDDLPFSFINFNLLPDPSPYDLRSVEVLKGPQGTLYGAGSSAGVVIVNTNDPLLNEYSGKADIQISDTERGEANYSLSSAVNIPLIEDKLAARATVSYQDNGGYIDDRSVAGANNLNDEERLNARLKLLYTPNEDLEIKFIAAASRIDRTISGDLADDNFEIDIVSFPTPGFEQTGQADYEQYGAVIKYELPGVTIRNSLSYLDYRNFSVEPIPSLAFSQEFDIQSVVNELRFSSNTDSPLSWVGGVFYRDTDQFFFQNLDVIGPVINFPTDDILDVTNSEQFSVFGEVSYGFNDNKIEIGAGFAYVDDSTTQDINVSPLPPVPQVEVETSEFLPQVNIAYHPTANSTLYFRYAEGLRAAVPNIGISGILASNISGSGQQVLEESTESFEIGFKGNFFDNQLYAEFAAYTIDIENLQQSAGFPFGAATLNTVLNINGDARSEGIEWLLNYTPKNVDGLELVFSGSLIDAEILDDELFNGTLVFPAGTPLNLTPDTILAAQASYRWALNSKWDMTLSANAQYTSERTLTVISSSPREGESVFTGNLRAELSNDRYSLYAFVNNVSNDTGIISPAQDQGLFSLGAAEFTGELGTRPRPRTFGAGIRFNF